ncbi:helix-turn-helix transcriptional regulator [Kitasatospora sp. NPDC049285]|uniref:helix-turn-helix domain-containing protein n=1 Tax=Kitasatospora sp. NPDC049285 TaxID=3157096 RepID=UPI003431C790
MAGSGSWQEFGALLRHWRRRAGWTQAQLATAVGYDHTAVSRLEHGTRRATPRLSRRLDELLETGGELERSCGRAERSDGGPAVPAQLLRPPLARSPEPGPAGFAAALPAPAADDGPSRLPEYDLLCPLHGASGCELPTPATAVALHAVFCGEPRGPLDTETVHALAAVLAAQLRAAARQNASAEVTSPDGPSPGAVVEGTLRAIVARLARAPGRQRRVLARLAAEYAHAAGALRLHGGRAATAMACFDRALGWAELADDAITQVAALSDMAVLGLLDGDPAASADYAREMRRAAPGRHWSGTLSQLGEARADALAGDVRATVRHVGRARMHLDHLDAADTGIDSDVPWLTPASLRLRVESGAAAALRDVAARSGETRFARLALAAAESALDLLGGGRLPSTRAMLTVRIADCHLCAGDPRTALAVLSPLLATDGGTLPALVRHELRGLRSRLPAGARGWGDDLAETALHLGAAP